MGFWSATGAVRRTACATRGTNKQRLAATNRHVQRARCGLLRSDNSFVHRTAVTCLPIQSSRMSAMSRLLSSCISMCVLPLMPMSGSTKQLGLAAGRIGGGDEGAAVLQTRRPARKLVDVIAKQHQDRQARIGRHVVGRQGAGAGLDRNDAGDALAAEHRGLERIDARLGMAHQHRAAESSAPVPRAPAPLDWASAGC